MNNAKRTAEQFLRKTVRLAGILFHHLLLIVKRAIQVMDWHLLVLVIILFFILIARLYFTLEK